MIGFSRESLLAALSAGYGIAGHDVSALEGGLDTGATVYLVTDTRGRRYVVKARSTLCPGISLSAWLAASGIGEVLAPIPTISDDAAFLSEDFTLVAYPFVDGANGFERELKSGHWLAVGKALARIHLATPPLEIQESIRTETFTVEGEDDFRQLSARLSTARNLPKEEEDLRDLIQEQHALIEAVLSRTRELGDLCRQNSWNFVPCHADIHVGNVLMGKDGSVHLIDWDAPRMAPIECDLVFFCGPGITGHSEAVEASFFEGYGPATIDAVALTYYRYVRAMEDIVSFARESIDPSSDDLAKATALRYFKMLFEPKMIVETAMNSYLNLEL